MVLKALSTTSPALFPSLRLSVGSVPIKLPMMRLWTEPDWISIPSPRLLPMTLA